MAKKSTWSKLYDKASKIDTDDFNDVEIKDLDNAMVVCAKDKFLSGWGEAEGQNCYQAVVCFTERLFYHVCESLENDDTFTLVCRYYRMKDFLKSNRKGILCVKNARLCHAWNGGENND